MSKAFLYGVGNGSGSSEEKPNLFASLVDRTITDVTAEDLQGVTYIGHSAFRDCDSLTSVVIPDSVTSIGNYAFYSCASLTSVVIGNSVTSIGSDAFEYCASLTSVVIGNSVTSISGYAFQRCNSLTEVNYLGTIDKWAEIKFSGEYSTPVYYTKGLKINGEEVTEVKLTTATKINTFAFYGFRSLTLVEIGDSVTSIDSSAFRGCSAMQLYDFRKVTAVPTLTNINAFTGIPSTCKIVVPDSLYDEWIVATNWSTYASNIVKASEYTEA